MAAAERSSARCSTGRPSSSPGPRRAGRGAALPAALRRGRGRGRAPSPSDDAFAGLACRIELFARLAWRTTSRQAQATAARAEKAGVPRAELETLRAAGSLPRHADRSPARLPVAAAPLLGADPRVAAAHAGLRALRAAAPTAGAARPWPEREQRELLASMYLRAGFLHRPRASGWRSASPRPDARALLGLARVARARAARRCRGVRRRGAEARPDQLRREGNPREQPGAGKRPARGGAVTKHPAGPPELATARPRPRPGQLDKYAKEALKFSAMRSITPPKWDRIPT